MKDWVSMASMPNPEPLSYYPSVFSSVPELIVLFMMRADVGHRDIVDRSCHMRDMSVVVIPAEKRLIPATTAQVVPALPCKFLEGLSAP